MDKDNILEKFRSDSQYGDEYEKQTELQAIKFAYKWRYASLLCVMLAFTFFNTGSKNTAVANLIFDGAVFTSFTFSTAKEIAMYRNTKDRIHWFGIGFFGLITIGFGVMLWKSMGYLSS